MKVLYVVILSFLLCGLGSCYEDKGNYDYTDILEIQIDSIRDSYSLYALTDTLVINPVVKPADGEYEFKWCVYETNVQGYAPKLDTLDINTQNIVLPMTLNPGTYGLVYMVKEKQSGITQIKEVPLNVVTALSEGWYVLRSQNGYTDLDLFSTVKGKIENVIAANNEGRRLKGEARAIEFSTQYKSWDEINERYVNTSTIFALAAENMVSLKTANGKIIRDAEDSFYEPVAVKDFQDIYGIFTELYLVNAGKAHTIYGMSGNSGRFGKAAAGDYELSLFRVHGSRGGLSFDKNSCSFLVVNGMTNTIVPFSDESAEATSVPPVNHLDADLLYMGPGPNFAGWALLKKRQQDYWLMYNLDANKACSPYKNPTIGCDTLRQPLNLLDADLMASSQDNNIIYFNKGNRIYSCNIDGGYAEKEQVVIPEGEITYMRHMKYSNYMQPNTSFNKLAVAAFANGRYKVYLYDIQAGNLQSNPQILEGDGKVGALIYINGNGKTTLY